MTWASGDRTSAASASLRSGPEPEQEQQEQLRRPGAVAPDRDFRSVFPARPEELRDLRGAIRSWLEGRPIAPSRRGYLLLAVNEACANAIDHAYSGRPAGELCVEIAESPDHALDVTVRDFGRFRPPAGVTGDRGRGNRIIRGLTTGFRCEPTPGGTTVRFRLPADGAVSA
jgi:anti-sigma regulatory factor (Ser/Thr protein kinase)